LKLLPVSDRTQQAYWNCVRQLADHHHKAPEDVSPEELRQYFIFLKCEKKVARQTATQAICAIKLFWEKSLRRLWPAEVELVRANPRFKLPVVLAAAEVRAILARVPLLDHRVALITIYSCGLRLGEGLRLQVRDIDSQRMFLHIRAGKGQRDRYVALPEKTLAYHSCNDRHCPQCGQADADQWLEAQSSRLLPVDYFLVTFTVPEGLRGWMRSQPQLGYDALFAASSRALLDLAANPRRLGAQLGLWGTARYVFQTATGNRPLTELPDGRVLWKYRDSQTRQWQSIALEKSELIRRFLQHVLPAGYHRVRRFGWLHPAAKTRRERVELLLGNAEITLADTAADPPLDAVEEEPFPKPAAPGDPPPPPPAIRKTFTCPRCAKPMCWIGSVWRGCAGRRPGPARAPPPKS
jgi:hypothetical protein